jgi:hypothetical protein
MATDHRGNPVGNPDTSHGGHTSRPLADSDYWRSGETWSTAAALQRLYNAGKYLTPKAYADAVGYTVSTAMDIWNNPHGKEY